MKKPRIILIYIIVLSFLVSVTAYGATPATANDYYKQGSAAFDAQKYEEAIKQADLALKLDPKMNAAYQLKAESLLELNKFDEGLRCVEAAIAVRPEDLENYLLKGLLLSANGKYPEAIEAFKKGLVEISYEYGKDAYYHMALSYLKLNDKESCLTTLREGVFLFSDLKDEVEKSTDFITLAENVNYIELMSDSREKIITDYIGIDFLFKDFFKDIAFIDSSESLSDSEKQEISLFDTKFNSSLVAGNIYNEATAKTYGVSDLSLDKKVIILAGRIIKKMSLIGFKSSYTPMEFEVLYTGKLNGQLKAALVRGKGKISYGSESIVDSEYYYVYIKNNGVWEYYSEFTPIN